MFGTVDKELLRIKEHFFLFNAATGPIVQFLPVIAKQLGFSATLTGRLYLALPASGIIAKPLFGSLADKFRLHKTFFLIFQVLTALSFFSINFIPKIERHANVTLLCEGDTFLEACPNNEFSEKAINDILSEKSYESSCKVSCQPSVKSYEELCNNWHMDDFCKYIDSNLSTVESNIMFKATFNMSHNLQVKKCVYVRMSKATFHDGVGRVPACKSQLRLNCSATSPDNFALKELLQQVPGTSEKSTYQFYLILLASALSWIGMAVVVTIADAICFDILGDERKKDYGKQRMWGSIGFGLFGIIAGYLVDVFSRGKVENDYTCVFYVMLIAMILEIAISSTLKKNVPDNCVNKFTLWETTSAVITPKILVFTWWCIGAGMCTGVVWNFLFWYIEQLNETSPTSWLKTLQGLISGVQCFLGELPFNFVSGSVLRKLGHINVMSLVLLVYAIRFMSYSVVSNPWIFLVLEVLHGPSLGLCWPTMVSYDYKAAAPGSRATFQGFVGGVFEGIGVASGSLLCGWLMDVYGGVVTFRIFSAGALGWLSIFWLLQLMLRQMKVNAVHQGHNHLASYAPPDDAIFMTYSQELQTY